MRNDYYACEMVGTTDNYLQHGPKGWVKKGAKYIKRAWKNGKWVYYYAKQAQKWSYQSRDRLRMRNATVQTAGEQAVRGNDTSWAKDAYNQKQNAVNRARTMTDNYYNMALSKATETFGKTGGQIITNLLFKASYVSDKKGRDMVIEDSKYENTSFGNKKYKGH